MFYFNPKHLDIVWRSCHFHYYLFILTWGNPIVDKGWSTPYPYPPLSHPIHYSHPSSISLNHPSISPNPSIPSLSIHTISSTPSISPSRYSMQRGSKLHSTIKFTPPYFHPTSHWFVIINSPQKAISLVNIFGISK